MGDEVYILPLSSVVESFQVNSDDVSTVAQGAQLVKVRDEYMPVIALERTFQVPRNNQEKSSTIMVVVEADGSRVALLVDELLGQHQVVVKSRSQLSQSAQCLWCHYSWRCRSSFDFWILVAWFDGHVIDRWDAPPKVARVSCHVVEGNSP